MRVAGTTVQKTVRSVKFFMTVSKWISSRTIIETEGKESDDRETKFLRNLPSPAFSWTWASYARITSQQTGTTLKAFGDRIYRLDSAELFPARRTLLIGGESQSIRTKAFDVLIYLVENRDRLVGKEELLQAVWQGLAVSDDSLVQCIAELRRVLGDSARNPHFIRTVTKVGYQFIGPVKEIVLPGASVSSMTVEEVTTVSVEVDDDNRAMVSAGLLPPGRRPRSRAILFVALGLLLLLAGAIVWTLRSRIEPSTTLPRTAGSHPVLVLYFDNESRSPDLEWLREGLADMMIADLSRAPNVNVLSRQQVATLVSRVGLKPGGAIRLEDALAMAKRAHAQTLLLGSFAKFGDKIRVTIQVHRGDDGSLVGTEVATAERQDQIIPQMGLLTLKVSRDLGARAVVKSQSSAIPVTSNLEAYRYYSLGMEQFAVVNTVEAVRLFEQAVKLDPQFAAAYAALGNAYTISQIRLDLGKANYEKAFQFPERLTDKDRLFITGGYAIANVDYPEAIRVFRQIVTKYPDEVQAYRRLGRLYEGEQRYDEAVDALQQGLAVDPDEPSLHNTITQVYCYLRRFDEAVAEAKRYVELTNGAPNAYDTLGNAYAWSGHYREAEQAYRAGIQKDPNSEYNLAHLAYTLGWEGRFREAVSQCEQLARAAPTKGAVARASEGMAWFYLRLGDRAKAGESARKALQIWGGSAMAALLAIDRGEFQTAEKLTQPPPALSARGTRGSDRIRLWLIGELALARGKGDEAIADFQKALREAEPIGGFDWRDDCLADAYLRLGRVDEAIAEYQRVLGLNPNRALARYHLAVAYERKSNRDQARDEYHRFLEIWKNADADVPEVKQAKTALARR